MNVESWSLCSVTVQKKYHQDLMTATVTCHQMRHFLHRVAVAAQDIIQPFSRAKL